MLACDCAVIPAVLNSTGEVLDIGRKSRIWPTAIRRAIELRDRTCQHKGCEVPAEHCDIHHKKHVRHEARDYPSGGERPPTLDRHSGSVKLRAA
jgi:Rieske Fe-S protein